MSGAPGPLSVPLYLEDLVAGQRFESAKHTLNEARIRSFAEEFDPQPFHLSAETAGGTFFDGLAASGWHTAAITMRLIVSSLPIAGGIIGAGAEIKWPRPTRSGDTVNVETLIVGAKAIDVSSPPRYCKGAGNDHKSKARGGADFAARDHSSKEAQRCVNMICVISRWNTFAPDAIRRWLLHRQTLPHKIIHRDPTQRRANNQSLSSVLTMVEHQYDTGNSYRRIAEDDDQLRTERLL
jgi:acyl dehydratase